MNYPFEVSPTEFKGKRVLVTGGTAGVGLATTKRFVLAGAKVLTTAREATDQLPNGVIFVKSDLATAEGTNLVAQEALSQLGGIDIIAHVVGGSSSPAGGFSKLSDEDNFGSGHEREGCEEVSILLYRKRPLCGRW